MRWTTKWRANNQEKYQRMTLIKSWTLWDGPKISIEKNWKKKKYWLGRKVVGQLFVCLCWGLTSQSTIFQSCRDGATASWVINQYFRGVKCLAQGHNTAAVGLEPPTSRSGVRHSTTEPPRSDNCLISLYNMSANVTNQLNFTVDMLVAFRFNA